MLKLCICILSVGSSHRPPITVSLHTRYSDFSYRPHTTVPRHTCTLNISVEFLNRYKILYAGFQGGSNSPMYRFFRIFDILAPLLKKIYKSSTFEHRSYYKHLKQEISLM